MLPKTGPRDRRLIAQATLLVPGTHGLKDKVRELLLDEGRETGASLAHLALSQGVDALSAAERNETVRLREIVNGVEVIAN
jgi:hypothetical protein